MDRLPRDVAQERMHHDIVKLLQEYRVNNGVSIPNGYAGSPNQMVPSFMHQPVTKHRQKNRQRKGSTAKEKPLSPHNQPGSVHLPPVHKPTKTRKKKAAPRAAASHASSSPGDQGNVTSPVGSLESTTGGMCELPPSYETAVSNGHMVLAQPNIPGLDDQCINTASLPAGHIHPAPTNKPGQGIDQVRVQELSPDNWLTGVHLQMRHHDSSPHDTSYTSSTSPLSQTAGSPPMQTFSPMTTGVSSVSTVAYSPQSQTHSPLSMGNSPPQSQGMISSPSQSQPMTVNSPPQSQRIGHSPPCSQPLVASPSATSVQGVMSPLKKGYPTSPTHLQAMHQHAQHNHQNHRIQQQPLPDSLTYEQYTNYEFDRDSSMLPYTPVANNCHQVVYPYPSPPSQHSQLSSEPSATPQHLQHILPTDHYLTPSPDSPGQWSSSSPHSAQSDWSEGISSPPMPVGQGHVVQHPANTNSSNNKRTDGFYC